MIRASFCWSFTFLDFIASLTWKKYLVKILKILKQKFSKNSENIETRTFGKPTNTDLYIHWQSFSPLQWKQSTMKTLVYRGYIICSNDKYLYLELKYLQKGSHHNKDYSYWFSNRVFDKVQDNFMRKQTVEPLVNFGEVFALFFMFLMLLMTFSILYLVWMVLNTTFWHICVEQQIGVTLIWELAKH